MALSAVRAFNNAMCTSTALSSALGAGVGGCWVVPCAESTPISLFTPILNMAKALAAFILSGGRDRVKLLDPY